VVAEEREERRLLELDHRMEQARQSRMVAAQVAKQEAELAAQLRQTEEEKLQLLRQRLRVEERARVEADARLEQESQIRKAREHALVDMQAAKLVQAQTAAQAGATSRLQFELESRLVEMQEANHALEARMQTVETTRQVLETEIRLAAEIAQNQARLEAAAKAAQAAAGQRLARGHGERREGDRLALVRRGTDDAGGVLHDLGEGGAVQEASREEARRQTEAAAEEVARREEEEEEAGERMQADVPEALEDARLVAMGLGEQSGVLLAGMSLHERADTVADIPPEEQVTADRACEQAEAEEAQWHEHALEEAGLALRDEEALGRLEARRKSSRLLKERVSQRKSEFKVLMQDAEEVHTLLTALGSTGEEGSMPKAAVVAAYNGDAQEAHRIFAALPERTSLEQWKKFCHQYHVEHELSDYLAMLLDNLVRGAGHLQEHVKHANTFYRPRSPSPRPPPF